MVNNEDTKLGHRSTSTVLHTQEAEVGEFQEAILGKIVKVHLKKKKLFFLSLS
jgi:hypothetical protein